MIKCRHVIAFIFVFMLSTATITAITSTVEPNIEYGILTNTSPLNITQNDRWQMNAAIWGDRVVWEDYRHDPIGAWSTPGLRNSCIYMFNITSGETVRLTNNDSSQVRPDIWENYVVWEDYRHGNADIYYMDLNTMTEHRVTTHASDQITPRIHNGRIVWVDHRVNMFGDIYMYDIEDGQERIIADGWYPQRNPDIYDDKIVWTDYGNYWTEEYDYMYADIFMYDLNLDVLIPFVEEPIHQHHPSIYGDTVAWIEYREGSNDIYMKRVGHQKTPVANTVSSEEDPRIYGGRIIYSERHYEGAIHTHDAIRVHDMATGANTMIARVDFQEGEPDGVIARFPAIYRDSIVWEERHLSQWENLTFQYDIFHLELGNVPPVIMSTSVSTDSDQGNHMANMTLKAGAYFTVTAEVVDPDGDLATVTLKMEDDELVMNEVNTNIFSVTVVYTPDMVSGEHEMRVLAEDTEGTITYSENLTVRFLESPPVITFVGVGTDMQYLTTHTNFTLEETNSLFFAADVTDPDSDLYSVTLVLQGFNLTQSEFVMTETGHGRYLFELVYQESMTEGEKSARVIAEDARGNTAESDQMTIRAIQPTPPENGILPTDGVFNWLFLLLLALLIVILIMIFYIKRKKDDTPLIPVKETTTTPEALELEKGVCPNCIEVIPRSSEVCPHCGEELDPPEDQV